MNPVYIVVVVVLIIVYVWVFYQIPVIAVGVKHLRLSSKRKQEKTLLAEEQLPKVSIVVPVKDEEKVVGRLLKALLKLDYPTDKIEILVVEDGSTDKTVEICEEYARRHPERVKLLHKPMSNGKPSALNFAFKYVKGEIVAVFDADNVPERDVLKKAVAYFNDPSVAAVQGKLCSLNADENMLTKLVSIEEVVWCEAYLRGKDVLGLFVHLKGTCQFIRREVLAKLGGFNEETLSEDMELSARLVENSYQIRYASDVCSWQETPSQVGQLFKQRTRWFRGTMQVAFKYGRLIAKPTKKSLDAELTLLGPFVLIASLICYLLAFYISFAAINLDALLQLLMYISAVGTSLTLMICGLALAYISKPRKLTNLLWLPFIYFYWSLQSFIALYALILMLLRKPQVWVKTEKKGIVTGAFAG
ncbi:MAG: glycosyltransferase family 2 protein [Candidatus Bathyarchaeia archaeon]|nr:glycosyltransferase family 2 protein [Candidatus Bathyarchaeota archaeon]